MNKKELSSREKLRLKKPKVLDKILAHEFDPIPRLQFQADYRCNMKCSHCSTQNVAQTGKKLTIEKIKDVFDQADAMGISRVTLTGGEPLLFPNLYEILDVIGMDRMYTQLDSNGYELNRENLVKLKNAGIDVIAPSLDSLDLVAHDTFRNKPGAAKRVLRAFDDMKDLEINNYVQTVLTHSRLYSQEFMDFIEYFNSRDIGVYMSFAKPVGNFEGVMEDLLTQADFDYIAELEKNYNCFSHLTSAYGMNTTRDCIASKNIFSLTAYGAILPCIYFYCSMGNVWDEPLKDIHERCLKLKPFQANTCVMANKDHKFIKKYLVPKIYGKKQPIPWQEVFTEEDFDD